jgi:hypothetical protein
VIMGVFVEAVEAKDCFLFVLCACHDHIEGQPFITAAGPAVVDCHAHACLLYNDRVFFGQRFFFFHKSESSRPQAEVITFCLLPCQTEGEERIRAPFRLPTVAAKLEEKDWRDSRVDYAALA